jgi:peptidoglycan/xylan/chitin deacetylase (PgdA/CDA1 family)
VNHPSLVISLDFELHWGRFDKYDLESNLRYYRNTRNAIPKMLELFDRYRIHATWATVGMLMAENEEEWRTYQPELLPDFSNKKISAYSWFDHQTKLFPEGLFAPELVSLILDCPNQELGSHSFSHYYTLEQGQNTSQWREDLRASKKISKEKFGVEIKSLVFPRNQYSSEAIKVAGEEGFKVVRTNPQDWFWKEVEKESLLKRIVRTGDTLFDLSKRTSYVAPASLEGVTCLAASRLMRPFRNGSIFNNRRITRIKEEIEEAMRNNEMYHLWWHPHNFGTYPTENLFILEDLLKWVVSKKNTVGLQSLTMVEAARIHEKNL